MISPVDFPSPRPAYFSVSITNRAMMEERFFLAILMALSTANLLFSEPSVGTSKTPYMLKSVDMGFDAPIFLVDTLAPSPSERLVEALRIKNTAAIITAKQANAPNTRVWAPRIPNISGTSIPERNVERLRAIAYPPMIFPEVFAVDSLDRDPTTVGMRRPREQPISTSATKSMTMTTAYPLTNSGMNSNAIPAAMRR